MKTLASIIRTPRRIARDTREQFADASEFFDGGIETLASWLGENVSDGDLESLAESIRILLHRRVQSQVTGGLGLDQRRPSKAEAEFDRMYPGAARLKQAL